MKALQIIAPGEYRIVEAPIPSPEREEVLIKVQACTVCNQHESKIFWNRYKGPQRQIYPLELGQPGHEGAGEVVALGEGVTKWKIGHRVAMHGGIGLYAQFTLRHQDAIAAIPSSLSFEEAAPTELVACLVNAVGMTKMLGKKVAVSGLGPAGLIAIQLCKATGAIEVVGIEPMEERRGLAMELGANAVFHPSQTDEMCQHPPFDIVVDCSGNVASLQRSFEIAKEEVIIFGYTDEPFQVQSSIWFARELTIRNAAMLGKNWGQNFQTAAALLGDGRVKTKSLLTHFFPLEKYAEGIDLADSKKALKVVIKPWD